MHDRLAVILAFCLAARAGPAARPPESDDARRIRECAEWLTEHGSLAVVPRPQVPLEPYPELGSPLPFDFSRAALALNPVATGPCAPPAAKLRNRLPIEEARRLLARYVVLRKCEWWMYSHVGDEEGGSADDGKGLKLKWWIRPGGLAWVVYPNGRTVFLAGYRPNPPAKCDDEDYRER